jgi:hypothetical protein
LKQCNGVYNICTALLNKIIKYKMVVVCNGLAIQIVGNGLIGRSNTLIVEFLYDNGLVCIIKRNSFRAEERFMIYPADEINEEQSYEVIEGYKKDLAWYGIKFV